MTYAKGTGVDVSGSQQEIARTLARYSVDTYAFAARPGEAAVQFEFGDVPIRVTIPLPERPAAAKVRNPKTGRLIDAVSRWEQQVREAWRALLLLLKANLEAVERGLLSAEQAFLAFLVAPDGRTVGELVLPAYREALTTGRLAITAGVA